MLGSREARRAQLYTRLAVLAESGIPLRTALDKLDDEHLREVARFLDDGVAPGEAWQRARDFTPLEAMLVKAGEKGGALVESFRSLARIFEDRARARRDLAAGLAYPVFLLHALVFLPQLPIIFTTGMTAFVRATIVPLGIAYAVLAAVLVLVPLARRKAPGIFDSLWAALPLLGGLAQRNGIVHGLQAFLALYHAGVPVDAAVDAAADAASFHPVTLAFRRVGARLDEGALIGDAFFQEASFPVVLRESASTGSVSGKLEEMLTGARGAIEAEAKTRKAVLVRGFPIVVYLIAVIAIGWTVISGYVGYFSNLEKIMDGR